MRSTFFGIEIGRTGLSFSQLGLDVTGHNIANVETAGYTRQRLVGTAYDPFSTIGRALPVEQALIGSGVKVKIHDQIRSAYLDRRFRTENTTFSYWNKRAESLRYVESFFDNVNEETSLNHSLAAFFEAMKVLADDPVETAPRKLLQTAGLDLVQQLNSVYDGLIALQESQNEAVEVTVGDINRIAKEIVELNKAIYGFEITGHIALDLRDKRNLLIDELSALIDVEYKEVPDGKGNTMLEVSVGGDILLFHDEASELGVQTKANTIAGEAPVWEPYWVSSIDPLVTSGDTLIPKGGELKAYLDMRDNDGVDLPGIPRYIEMLNDLARILYQEINGVHFYGWNDPPLPPSTNEILFFDAVPGVTVNPIYDVSGNLISHTITGLNLVTAKNIRLSDDILASETNIACSSVQIDKWAAPEDQQRGNNININKMYELYLDKGLFVGPLGPTIGSFDGYVTSIRFDVGNTLNYAKKLMDTSFTLTLAAENQRVSISGVSLDEEMTNLMKYQHAYSGAARVITAMDEALDRLINGTGRVGL